MAWAGRLLEDCKVLVNWMLEGLGLREVIRMQLWESIWVVEEEELGEDCCAVLMLWEVTMAFVVVLEEEDNHR